MQFLSIIVPIILAVLTGYALLNIFLRKEHIYLGEYMLYSFFVGIFAIGFTLFFSLVFGARLDMWWNTLLPLIIAAI